MRLVYVSAVHEGRDRLQYVQPPEFRSFVLTSPDRPFWLGLEVQGQGSYPGDPDASDTPALAFTSFRFGGGHASMLMLLNHTKTEQL